MSVRLISEQSVHSFGVLFQLLISCIFINSNSQNATFFCIVREQFLGAVYHSSVWKLDHCDVVFKSVDYNFHAILLTSVGCSVSKVLSPLLELRSPLSLFCFSNTNILSDDTFFLFLFCKQPGFGCYL